jgi:hypothetical protein
MFSIDLSLKMPIENEQEAPSRCYLFCAAILMLQHHSGLVEVVLPGDFSLPDALYAASAVFRS